MNKTIHTDAPEVQALCLAAFPDYNGRKFSVESFTGPRRLISMWCEGSRDYFAVLNLATGAARPLPDGITEFPELPVGLALIERTIYRSKELGCRIYVRPENLAPLLPAPGPELSLQERIVLSATRSYKPSYAGRKNNRLYEAQNYTGISAANYDAAKTSLIASGHLSKAGAITDKGRNAIGDVQLSTLATEVAGRLNAAAETNHFTDEVKSAADSAEVFIAEAAREMGVDTAELFPDFAPTPAPVVPGPPQVLPVFSVSPAAPRAADLLRGLLPPPAPAKSRAALALASLS